MATQLDIVKLIEKTPITRLSQDYQHKLLNKIKTKFTDSQQQLFVASFYCYLNHNSKTEFIIDLDNVWKWLGFSRKDQAKRCLTNNFIDKLDYKIVLLFKEENLKGGRPQEQILMSINTFKKFCLKAGTKKADEIHEYYIGLEELLQETLNEETNELRKQLENKSIQDKNMIKLNNHNLFIDKFSNKRCVYLIEIEEDKYIKVGSTKDIKKRLIEYKRTYKGSTLLFIEVFECEYFREIEESILQDSIIRQNLQREPVCRHKSNEIIRLSDNFNYNQLLTIIKNYLSNNTTLFTPAQIIEKNKIELENNKLEFNLLNSILNNDKYSILVENIIKDKLPEIFDVIKNKQFSINNLLQNDKKHNDTVNKDKKEQDIKIIKNNNAYKETEIPNYRINTNSISRQIKAKGKQLLKIDPNNLKHIVKVYDTITYALRDNDNKGYQTSGIRKATKLNNIYKGYRWLFIEKDKTIEDTISNIQPNKETKKSHPVYDSILKLNNDKTKILESYSSINDMATKFNISSTKAKDIIKNNIKYDDKYFIEFYKCSKNLLDSYTGTIKRRVITNTKIIKQINPITNEIIIFNSMSEITKLLGYSCKTIHKAIKTQNIFCGFRWEYYKE
jgi:hypothetical protein